MKPSEQDNEASSCRATHSSSSTDKNFSAHHFGYKAQHLEAYVWAEGTLQPVTRHLINEAPLRIFLNQKIITTLMCTPEAAEELTIGYLLTEKFINSLADIVSIQACEENTAGVANAIYVQLKEEAIQFGTARKQAVFSSCCVSGHKLIEAVAASIPPFFSPLDKLQADDIFALRDILQERQQLFRLTGGTHAAALGKIPFTKAQEPIAFGEDIGRYNALDKAVGAALKQGLPLDKCLLMLSGRISLEMTAKAACAGIQRIAAVGAPSALSVALARRLKMFLAGFVRGKTMTIYAGHEALQKED